MVIDRYRERPGQMSRLPRGLVRFFSRRPQLLYPIGFEPLYETLQQLDLKDGRAASQSSIRYASRKGVAAVRQKIRGAVKPYFCRISSAHPNSPDSRGVRAHGTALGTGALVEPRAPGTACHVTSLIEGGSRGAVLAST